MADLILPVLALIAGIVSFSSPCSLPLIPGYLSYMSALPVDDLGNRAARSTILKAALLFVGGFTVVFTALGASFALVGSLFLRNVDLITRIAGVGIIVMGLAMLGVLRIPGYHRELRVNMTRAPRGLKGAFPMGMAFAVGWTPCIGPILATILTVAGASQTVVWGAALLAIYSLGLGIPFVLVALGFQRARGSLTWLKRNGRRVEIVGGSMLIAVGVMFTSGIWRAIFIPLQSAFARLGWPPI
ncbi:thiol:disulfide interchange protein precursor [bacterium BMS3Abin02]|nr:thiol:disulfide interchange protein precursor [bacterium BMS3Abin02]GBE22139.1 thiol:disulfide interchange protein precursor [bacterium BMS3Bbin01]HDH25525.1 cytochrome C biogenesis protein [Actinomycetota bacterium]HDK45645.1 cytochrome C biogenesis protein [Actinomycetota bacterium]HDL50118.1 cytochrome C biogenesis protein [Actinomycetota bacterium]